MKAIAYTKYGPPDVLEIKEAENPTPKDNELLIKIYASAVTSVDCSFRAGVPLIGRFFTGLFKPKRTRPGTVLAGEIEAIGKDINLFQKGDQVFGATPDGYDAHAEFICLTEEGALTIKPSNMNYEEAAAIPYGALTALPFLRENGDIKSGQKVLISGASGSIGTSAVQLAKYYGAEVTGVCSTANLDLVTSLGADKVIDYTEDDFTQNGESYDIIFDTVAKSSFSRCKRSLMENGIYLSTFPAMALMMQMLWTAKIGDKKAIFAATGLRSPAEKNKDLIFLKELVEAGKLKAVIDREYPLEQIVEANSYVEKGHQKGNVVITLGQNN